MLAIGVRLGLRATAASLRARLNPVSLRPPYAARAAARRLHEALIVADLHSDCLLWGTDLRHRSRRGHLDIPRLIEGKVALQVFSAVTKVPRRERDATYGRGPDLLVPLSVAEMWPPAGWLSAKGRALYQARRLARMAERSGGVFTLVRSRPDLHAYLERRAITGQLTAGVLSLEGAHGFAGDELMVDELFQAGFRVVGLTHFFDNEIGGSSWGQARYGLTDLGRKLVEQLEARRMIVDLAHAAPALIRDVLAVATRPVLVTHSGLQAICENSRNLEDHV
ncbi:MAG: dipeptidase, partial [Anaerolineae bacterium]